MFSRLKALTSLTAKPATPAPVAENPTPNLNTLFASEQLAGKPMTDYITELQHHGDALEVSLRLDDAGQTEELEALHQRLGQRVMQYGIYELNFNVKISPSQTTSNAYQTQSLSHESVPAQSPSTSVKLPPVIDAAQPPVHTVSSKTASTNTVPSKTAAANSVHTETVPSESMSNESMPTETTFSKNEPAKNDVANAAAKSPPRQADLPPHPRIRHIVVVASGKGGVGKSTTTVNLALALQGLGHKVGVLDADIYGPSIPTMLGVAGIKPEVENDQFVPIAAHGLAMLSIGNLLESEQTPVAWRGPKATGALMQLFSQTNWPMLDYLLIDMPPGTGDIQLTLAQRIPVTAAIIVTTPQHIALLDAQKGIEMFAKTHIPVLGIVENMATHICSNCGHTEAIFGEGGGSEMAERYQVPLLGQLPLATGIRAQADKGVPSVAAKDAYSGFYEDIAQKITAGIQQYAKTPDTKRIL